MSIARKAAEEMVDILGTDGEGDWFRPDVLAQLEHRCRGYDLSDVSAIAAELIEQGNFVDDLTMSDGAWEKFADLAMGQIRENECFNARYPKKLTADFLKDLRSAINMELETLGINDWTKGATR